MDQFLNIGDRHLASYFVAYTDGEFRNYTYAVAYESQFINNQNRGLTNVVYLLPVYGTTSTTFADWEKPNEAPYYVIDNRVATISSAEKIVTKDIAPRFSLVKTEYERYNYFYRLFAGVFIANIAEITRDSSDIQYLLKFYFNIQ